MFIVVAAFRLIEKMIRIKRPQAVSGLFDFIHIHGIVRKGQPFKKINGQGEGLVLLIQRLLGLFQGTLQWVHGSYSTYLGGPPAGSAAFDCFSVVASWEKFSSTRRHQYISLVCVMKAGGRASYRFPER